MERAQDIVFSTQALRTIDARAREHRRHMIYELSAQTGSEQRAGRGAELAAEGRANAIAMVLIAYRAPAYEMSAKMVDFSRALIDERWAVGLRDMNAALIV